MQDEIFMDIPIVEQFSKQFEGIEQVLKAVDTALETLLTTLQSSAFIGEVGDAAVERYVEQLRPVIQNLAEKCQEMSQDLTESATAYQNEDMAVSRYF